MKTASVSGRAGLVGQWSLRSILVRYVWGGEVVEDGSWNEVEDTWAALPRTVQEDTNAGRVLHVALMSAASVSSCKRPRLLLMYTAHIENTTIHGGNTHIEKYRP